MGALAGRSRAAPSSLGCHALQPASRSLRPPGCSCPRSAELRRPSPQRPPCPATRCVARWRHAPRKRVGQRLRGSAVRTGGSCVLRHRADAPGSGGPSRAAAPITDRPPAPRPVLQRAGWASLTALERSGRRSHVPTAGGAASIQHGCRIAPRSQPARIEEATPCTGSCSLPASRPPWRSPSVASPAPSRPRRRRAR